MRNATFAIEAVTFYGLDFADQATILAVVHGDLAWTSERALLGEGFRVEKLQALGWLEVWDRADGFHVTRSAKLRPSQPMPTWHRIDGPQVTLTAEAASKLGVEIGEARRTVYRKYTDDEGAYVLREVEETQRWYPMGQAPPTRIDKEPGYSHLEYPELVAAPTQRDVEDKPEPEESELAGIELLGCVVEHLKPQAKVGKKRGKSRRLGLTSAAP